MTISADTWFLVGAIVFYLYDSIRLVPSDHALLVRSFTKWSAVLPKGFLKLQGKLIYLPNPFTPFNALFQAKWTYTRPGLVDKASEELIELAPLLQPFQSISILLFVEMLVILPAIGVTSGLGTQFLAALFLVYLTIASAIYKLHKCRQAFGMNKKTFLSIAFDCIACPPFAINIVRKISKSMHTSIDFVKFSKTHVEQKSYNFFAMSLDKEIKETLEYDQPSASDAHQLLEIQKTLDIKNQ